jgi:hypothetical protein
VEHVDTNFNHFVVGISVNDELSLFMLESDEFSLSLSPSLSPIKNRIENDENKI